MKSLSLKYKIAISLLNLLSKTWRIEINQNIHFQNNGIVIFWHGFMLPVWKYFGKFSPTAVVSLSKDGEILSQLLEKWGFELIRGSSSKKGREVLDEIIESSKNNLVLMTPDGPRGPRYEMKAGAVVAAFKTGTPLYLCGVGISNKIIFSKSWDKFHLPLPFSKIKLIIEEPVYIESNSDKELINIKISELQSKLLLLYSEKP